MRLRRNSIAIERPNAIVIGLGRTGLGVVRCLARNGIEVEGIALSREKSPGRWSRYCRVIERPDALDNPASLIEFLHDHARKMNEPPVVLPTTDVTAILLAENQGRLQEVCRLATMSLSELSAIINKDRLYAMSTKNGIPVPPSLAAPNGETLRAWCDVNSPPYILKPQYSKAPDNTLNEKNREFDSVEDLATFVHDIDSSGLIVQRMIKGGDGWVFDCYGLCDRHGSIVAMASHRRIRQHPPHAGVTSFGEIPIIGDHELEASLFQLTTRLLSCVSYHGIFGIEWVQEQATGNVYLIDFNARAFLPIIHLADCGLNLPMLAYDELCGNELPERQGRGKLRHLFWLDFNADLKRFRMAHKAGQRYWGKWIRSMLRSRSFACWNWRDPGPAILRFWELVLMTARWVRKSIR